MLKSRTKSRWWNCFKEASNESYRIIDTVAEVPLASAAGGVEKRGLVTGVKICEKDLAGHDCASECAQSAGT